MTRADLLALAERVEREEPSRRLDEWLSGMFSAGAEVLPYTSSLDAAVTLCPPAWSAEVKDLDEADGAWSCVLTHSLLPKKAWGNAPDEPRARTAAALRALALEPQK